MILDTLLFIFLSVSLTYLCCNNILWFLLLCSLSLFNVQIKTSWFNWFEILKLISCLLGILVIEYYPQYIHHLIVINILEAVIKDNCKLNSLLGILVMVTLNPQSILWVVIYSIWNAVFTYTYGFSWSTRVVLLTPIILFDMWVKARVYSLLINMLMRASEMVYLFRSGESYLTY